MISTKTWPVFLLALASVSALAANARVRRIAFSATMLIDLRIVSDLFEAKTLHPAL